jgi:hypothetical protein
MRGDDDAQMQVLICYRVDALMIETAASAFDTAACEVMMMMSLSCK